MERIRWYLIRSHLGVLSRKQDLVLRLLVSNSHHRQSDDGGELLLEKTDRVHPGTTLWAHKLYTFHSEGILLLRHCPPIPSDIRDHCADPVSGLPYCCPLSATVDFHDLVRGQHPFHDSFNDKLDAKRKSLRCDGSDEWGAHDRNFDLRDHLRFFGCVDYFDRSGSHLEETVLRHKLLILEKNRLWIIIFTVIL